MLHSALTELTKIAFSFWIKEEVIIEFSIIGSESLNRAVQTLTELVNILVICGWLKSRVMAHWWHFQVEALNNYFEM